MPRSAYFGDRRPDPDLADALLEGCRPPHRPGPVMVARAYFDESGTDKQSNWVVLAGWVAHADKWRMLSNHWATILKRPDYDVDEFKAADLQAKQGEFRGWEDSLVLRFRLELAALYNRFVRFGVVVAIFKPDYEAVVVPPLPKGHPWHDPYVFAMASAMGLAFASQHLRPNERLAFVFDEGHRGEELARRFFRWMRTNYENGARIIGDFNVASSIDFPPLQAADMLVWGSQRGSRRDLMPVRKPQVVVRGIFRTKCPIESGWWDAPALSKLIAAMGDRFPPQCPLKLPPMKKRRRHKPVDR